MLKIYLIKRKLIGFQDLISQKRTLKLTQFHRNALDERF